MSESQQVLGARFSTHPVGILKL